MTKPETLRHAADIYEAAESGNAEWNSDKGWITCDPFTSIATPELYPTRWRIKPKPVSRPWNCPEDVPMPICWIKPKHTFPTLIIGADKVGVFAYSYIHSSIAEWTWERIQQISATHSTDGVTWKPCTVEESK